MGRTSIYNKGIKEVCYNPQCINGGAPADFENRKCRLDPDNDEKVFCAPECGAHYLEYIDDIEQESRFLSMLKTKKSRHVDALAEAMYIVSKRKLDKETAKKIIRELALWSPLIGKKL